MKKKSTVVTSSGEEQAVGAVDTAQHALPAAEWEAFVKEAYLNLLDRPADSEGLKTYVAQLASGSAKELILAKLEACPEGQRVALRRLCSQRIYGDS